MRQRGWGFLGVLAALFVIMIVGSMVGQRGGILPTALGVVWGLLLVYLMLYSFDWLPGGSKEKDSSERESP